MTKYIQISLIFLVACTSNTQSIDKTHTFKKTFYPNGKLKMESFYLNDTIEDGLSKCYDTLGNLYLETFYKNGKKEGIEKGYLDSKNLEYVAKFKDGKQDSISTWYYRGGQISSKENWKNGKKFLSTLEFYPNQNVKEYCFYNFQGELVYRRKYNENGVFLNEEGDPIIIDVVSWDLKVGDSFKAKIYVATPVGYEISVFSGFGKNGNLQPVSLIDGVSTYNYVFHNKGAYKWFTRVHIKDKQLQKDKDNLDSLIVTVK